VQDAKTEFDTLKRIPLNTRLSSAKPKRQGPYEELLRKIREASINATFRTIPFESPTKRGRAQSGLPRTKINVLLAFLFSTLLAVV